MGQKRMMKINLGINKDINRIELDFDKEKINFILLVGETGAGKSIFHRQLYKQLSEKYSSDEIGFVFLDNTMVDFNDWESDYLIKSVFGKPKEAVKVLHELVGKNTNKKIFVHIEECDMVYADKKGVELALDKIKELKNIYIVYSTSRIDRGYLHDWMQRFVDLKVVFRVPTEDDSNFLIGNTTTSHFNSAGERVLVFNNQQVHCQPFTDKEVESLSKFKL